MSQFALQLGLILALLVGAAVAVWATPRLIRSFEFRRRFYQVLAAWFFGCVLLLSYSNGTVKQTNGAVFFLILATGCALVEALRQKRPKDCRQDYLHDPTHCGRCGHNLSAGAEHCLRCGWAIPQADTPLERRDWGLFWRSGWRIDYLENWSRTLMFCLVCMFAFAAMAAWFINLASFPTALLAACMALLFSLNLLRVVQYAAARRII